MKSFFTSLIFLITLQSYAQCNYKAIDIGFKVLALKEDNTMWTWGLTSNGEATPPQQVGTNNDWVMISAGGSHYLAIKSNGTLWAWGDNTFGQLGIPFNPNNNLTLPIQVGTDTDWSYICTGNTHSAAIKSNGTLWTWGRNVYGQLGNGTWTDTGVPTQIGTDTDWKYVEAQVEMMAAVKTNHTIWTWGDNEFGGLGDGTTVIRNTPTQVGNDNDWKSIKAARYYCLAIRNDNTLWGWGNNFTGQLGDGTTIDRFTPIQIGTENDWYKILTGEHHALAIKNNGTLWTWGGNDFGQLGIGSQTAQYIPTQIGTENDWSEIGIGTFNSFAIKVDGSLYFWGRNNRAQLFNYVGFNSIASVPMYNNCELDLNSFTTSTLNIYPNPTTNYLTLHNPLQKIVNKVSILNVNGQTVFSNLLVNDRIDVSHLPSGIYMITIACEDENYNMRFVKK